MADPDHQAWAFARLDRPDRVRTAGRVGDERAWSTSKVLVVAGYLQSRVGGDPGRIPAADRRLIRAALTRSDEDAVVAVRARIVGRPGTVMTRVLRSVGDRETVAPDRYQGLMRWSLREQVRFAAALDAGRVVSPTASRWLLDQLRPVPEHRWGLGRIGATAFKGGWLRADTATRQVGLVDGWAVAISTDAGPVRRQTDGDDAHVTGMDALARRLASRLDWERRCR